MQNEFKYIPYDRKDTNIRGLIKNGNVYNLIRSMSGLLLPDDPNEEQSRAEKDWAYLKEMYPERVRRISAMVEEECDKLEYAGSPMFAEYPDPEVIRKIARDVYAELPDPYVDIHLDMEAAPSEPPYVPKGKGCGNCMMRNLIETLICNEFYCRRERYRRCRRRFYL